MRFKRFVVTFENAAGIVRTMCYAHFDERSAIAKALAIAKELEGGSFYVRDLHEEEFEDGE